jgi:hypothetical protein
VLLKLDRTGRRFSGYELGDAAIERRGPSTIVLRMIGALLVLSTVGAVRHRQHRRPSRRKPEVRGWVGRAKPAHRQGSVRSTG